MYRSTPNGPEKVVRAAMEIWATMCAACKFVCCGIDPGTIESLPWQVKVYDHEGNIDVEETLFRLGSQLVDATASCVGYFKPNAAFWEKYGDPGMRALRRLVRYVHENYPGHLIVVDAKANDLGKTANDWAYKYLVWYGFDGITVNPYMGWDCIEAFAKYQDKMIIVLVRTSNPSSVAMQDMVVVVDDALIDEAARVAGLDPTVVRNRERITGQLPYYKWVAWQVSNLWNQNGNLGVVIGATAPEQMAELVELLPEIPILSPGFGKQGASVEKIIPAAIGEDGMLRVIANSSSGVMYAFNEEKYCGLDWQGAAAAAVRELQEEIMRWRRTALTKRLMQRVGALNEGHFVLQKGGHASGYLDKDRATQRPMELAELAELTAEMLDGVELRVVVGPAYGAISLASAIALALNKRRGLSGEDQILSIPLMKAGNRFELRPNHAKLVEGESVVVAEDITTTGDSAAKSCLTLLHVGARVVAVTAIWNRGGVNDIEGSERFLPLVSEELPKYAADDCPLCMEGTPISTDLGHGQTYLDENGLINCLKCGRLHKADASCGV